MVHNFLLADYVAVTEMLLAITSSDGRAAAIKAAAKSALSKDDWLLFEAVNRVAKPSRSRRNDFVHHLWAVSQDLPDALCLVDPRYMGRYLARLDAWRDSPDWRQVPPQEFDSSHVMVYRDRDLQEDVQAAQNAHGYYHLLNVALSAGHPAAGEMRKLLLSQPPIQQALQALSQQNAP